MVVVDLVQNSVLRVLRLEVVEELLELIQVSLDFVLLVKALFVVFWLNGHDEFEIVVFDLVLEFDRESYVGVVKIAGGL